jgi:hypothetical protein
MVIVLPAIVQLPVALKLTGRPEEALAATSNGASPSMWLGTTPKVIVWLALAIVKVRVTSGAGVWSTSPVWRAVMLQLPAPVSATVVPAMVQVPGAL